MRSDSALIEGKGKDCTASRSNANASGLGYEGPAYGPSDESTCMRPERPRRSSRA